MPTTTPQDHEPKKAPFKFKADGKMHTLPDPGEASSKVPGGVTQDAIMYPDDTAAQLRLAYFVLEGSKAKPEALAALRALPTDEMLEVMGAWMGGSSASSD